MSKLEKAKERLKRVPRDYTYEEAKSLLKSLGFDEFTKGKTSGSRVRYYREKDKAIVDLHKPHPKPEMQEYAVKQLADRLEEYGDL